VVCNGKSEKPNLVILILFFN